MIAYYRDRVIGGRASFVMSIDSTSAMADGFVRKFLGDIVADSAGGLLHGPATTGGL
jgi:hypothetical protein